ncbi:MAG: CDP-diacylglycerol--serine O-phosphatidyltransferase [Bacteroidota bacterium]|nr:CDP-diacylglycerol--serine O-phosphatidyltransferase [Bacteroidota bacterium]
MSKHLPNLFTLINLSLGFFSILLSSQGNFSSAALLILFASIADFLDGFLAKKLNAVSDLGKQLDSLSDMITFGLSPSILMYYFLLELPQTISPYSNYLVVLIPIFSALRLAKFNIDANQDQNFKGLPTPANALFFASLVYFLSNNQTLFSAEILYKTLLVLIMIFSYLLNSNVMFFSLKFFSSGWVGNEFRYAFLLICLFVIAIAFFMNILGLSVSIIILLYIVLSLLNNINIKNEI